MGMSFKIRTNLRWANELGLMPKRVSMPAINSWVSKIKVCGWLVSSDEMLEIRASALDVDPVGKGK